MSTAYPGNIALCVPSRGENYKSNCWQFIVALYFCGHGLYAPCPGKTVPRKQNAV